MVDKTLKKAKGYAAQICVLLKSNHVITMGEAVTFPSLKILSMKTVNTYVTMNETIDARGQSDEPSIANVAVVKRKSQSKKKSDSSEKATGEAQGEVISEIVVSRKRPTDTGDEPVVTKKKRTSKSKASFSKTSTAMVTVAQDVEPLQIFEPTPATTAEQPPMPKRKSKKRRLVLSKGSDDEYVAVRVAIETVENVQQHVTVEGTITDDVDVIIGHVLAETSQLETIEGEQGEQHFDKTTIGDIAFGSSLVDQSDNLEQWFEDFVSRDTETVFTSNSDLDRVTRTVGTVADEEHLQVFVEKETVEKSAGSNPTDEELMSIDDLLMQISDNMMLPSVTAAEVTKIRFSSSIEINEVQDRDWYYANLPRISTHDKGKEPLEEDEFVKGNPAREMVQLICGDVDFLVQLRDQAMKDVVELFHSFSLNKLSDLDSLRELKEKEKYMLLWAEANSLETAVKRRVYILAKYREMLIRKFLDSHQLQAQQQEHGIIMNRPSSSQSSDDSAAGSGAVLAQFYSLAKSICWVRPMILVYGIWTPLQGNDYWRSSCRLSIFVNRKRFPERIIEENFVPHGYFIDPIQYWGSAPSIIKSWGWFQVCLDIVRYSMFGCLRPVRDENFCREIVDISSVVDVVEKLPSHMSGPVLITQDYSTNKHIITEA
ncbi:CBL-interacting protein kinase 10-like [Dorcoceras hygrometricum]|uniref:CBL-interacting protein kinase 10-like n=1 Tax=Dorcoceras hygrometricum TaxID=472368 RepID=A0A2Z7ARH8_9LAMI|nr:CBL-interacting protein kinase 10-like [Dorcoceras hygrometricum]